MVDRTPALLALTSAAEKLTRACTAHIAIAAQNAPPPAPPMTSILRHAFGDGALTPTDMLRKLGQMK